LYNSNINLWFANNTNNDIVTINEIEVKDNKEKYYCPLCGSEVIPKATKSKLITAHFAHVDASKCSSESMLHWWFKHKFLESGDKFKVVSDKEREYICKEVLVEQSYTVGDRLYRPDVTIKTECGNVIYFEMKFSNEKKLKDYIDIWLELKNIVVEIDIKSLLNKDKLPVFNALFYDGKCFNVKKRSDDEKYYNTIGKYKEEILNKVNNVDDELRARLQKLDWFWNEVINYKKDKLNIEEFVDFVDYNETKEKSLIFEILSTKRCTPIYEDYINYKVNLFYKLANDLINDNNENFFKRKLKIGRKYKNIKYNTIKFSNKYSINSLIFEVDKFTKEEYIQNIKDNISTVMLKIYYNNRAKQICSLIKKMYKDISDGDGLNINIYNNISNYSGHLYNIYLNKYYIKKNSIFICDNCIKYNDKIINFTNSNELLIINFVTNSINMEINKYNQYIFENNNIKIQIERNRKEKILQEINEERTNFNYTLTNIANILVNNNKIISCQLDYMIEDKCNLLYFKDYRGIKFLIHGKRSHLHDINSIEKDYYSNGFENYKGDYKLIEIDLRPIDDIYIIEKDDSYRITNNKEHSLIYNYPILFNNYEINFSFRNINNNTNYLSRYNFVDAIDKLNNLSKEIYYIKYNYLNYIYDEYKNNIYSNIEFTDQNINKEIYKILYPIIYLIDKTNDKILNIKLNVDFTIQDGKKQPWLIKNFIESLNNVGIYNIHNII